MVTGYYSTNKKLHYLKYHISAFFLQTENYENGEAELGLSWAVKVLDASKDGEIVKFTIQTNMVRRFRVQLIMKQYTLLS